MALKKTGASRDKSEETMMVQFKFTARNSGDKTDYTALAASGLRAAAECISGTGTAEDPWVVEVGISAERDFCGVIRIAMPVSMEQPRFYLPGVIYGTNRGDAPLLADSNCPRLRLEEQFPASPWWMFRSDRLSHPCAFAYGSNRLEGLAAAPYYVKNEAGRIPWQPGIQGDFDQYAGFGCSLHGAVYYTLGYENAPWFFLDSHSVFSRGTWGENCFSMEAGETVQLFLYCFSVDATEERRLHGPLKWVYRHYHQAPRSSGGVRRTVKEISDAIARDAWLPEEHSYAGFVFDRGDHFDHRILPSISWTNGLSASVPMLLAAHRLRDAEKRRQALENIQHIVDDSLNEKSGLPYMAETNGVWSNHGWWFDRQHVPGHAAYLVGQSVYLILKAYEWEKKNGTDHGDWLAFAGRVIDKTECSQNADGEYPFVFSEKTGAGLEYDSLSGAWCLAAAAYYCLLTGQRQFLPQLLSSERWYHDAYVIHQECYGGPLDTDKNMDSEGILAYIRAVRRLHELTGEGVLLEHLRDALYYEFTFKFCYNSPIKVPPLSTVGWSSCGGSITSVTNPHIHPMSSSVLDELQYFLRQTEDPYIRSRMEDVRQWSCQCHATFDGEYGYGRKGWMSERFCHCQGLLKEHFPDGSLSSTWFALMPWACGSLLEGLAGDAWDVENDETEFTYF